MKRRFHSMAAFSLPLAGLLCVGCFDDDDDEGGLLGDGRTSASAVVRGFTDTAITGTVRFDASGDSLRIHGFVAGLAPNSMHGFHVHQFGNCSHPDSGGQHFGEPGEPHGHPGNGGTHHRGDLPNLSADSAGRAEFDFMTALLTISQDDTSTSVLGRSVMVHENMDDYVTQPSGGSGTPIACGVISANGNGNGGLDTTGTDTTVVPDRPTDTGGPGPGY